MDSIELFASHVCDQLAKFAQVRVRLIEIYDSLSNCCSTGGNKKSFDDLNELLKAIQLDSESFFHHPSLALLRHSFMNELDVLMNLFQANQALQGWLFYPALSYIQEAHTKLGVAVARKDSMIYSTYNGNNSVSGSANAPSSTGNNASISIPILSQFLREKLPFQAQQTVQVSGVNQAVPTSVTPVNTPTLKQSDSGNSLQQMFLSSSVTNQSSSSSLAPTVYNRSNSISSASNVQMSINSLPSSVGVSPNFHSSILTMPALYLWLNRFKLFLLSKYTFYFHTLLMVNLVPVPKLFSSSPPLGCGMETPNLQDHPQIPPTLSNLTNLLVQTEINMQKLTNGKFLFDIHSRIVQQLKKYEHCCCLLLLLDVFEANKINVQGRNHISFQSMGYKSPYSGNVLANRELNTLDGIQQVIYCHPREACSRINLVELVDIVQQRKIKQEGEDLFHFDKISPSSSIMMLKPDWCYTLVLINDGKKLTEKDVNHLAIVLKEICFLLKGSKVFASLKDGSIAGSGSPGAR